MTREYVRAKRFMTVMHWTMRKRAVIDHAQRNR